MEDHAISEENCGFQKGTGGNPKQGGDPPPLASCVASRPRRNGAPISLPGRLAQRKPDGRAAFPTAPVQMFWVALNPPPAAVGHTSSKCGMGRISAGVYRRSAKSN